jgi:hypothetical protein
MEISIMKTKRKKPTLAEKLLRVRLNVSISILDFSCFSPSWLMTASVFISAIAYFPPLEE